MTSAQLPPAACWWCESQKTKTYMTLDLVAIVCSDCGARGPWKKNTSRAIQSWNKGPKAVPRKETKR